MLRPLTFQIVALMTISAATAFAIPATPRSLGSGGQTLETLEHAVAKIDSYDGVGGIVLTDTVPDGRPAKHSLNLREFGLVFGYNLDPRIAFIRQRHVDPIDLWTSPPIKWSSDIMRLRDDGSLMREWTEERMAAHGYLLNTLASDNQHHPPLVYVRQKDGWNSLVNTYIVSTGAAAFSVKLDGTLVGASSRVINELPMKYVNDPAFDLARLSAIPEDVPANEVAFEQWLLDGNCIAPLSEWRLVDAIQRYSNAPNAGGIVLDLTADGGLAKGVEEFVSLANKTK